MAPAGALLGWLLLASLNAAFLARRPRPLGGWPVRWSHHLFDAGTFVAVGVLMALAVGLWVRFGPVRARARWRAAVLLGASAGLGAAVLSEDLLGLTTRLLGRDGGGLAVWPLSAVAGCVVAASVLGGRWLAARRTRVLLLLAGLLLGVANQLLLPGGYPGIHLIVSVIAASTLGVWCAYAWPVQRGWRWLQRRVWLHRLVWGAVTLAGTAALAVKPAARVQVELFAVDAQPIAPWVTAARAFFRASPPPSNLASDWFKRRDDQPDVPPTQPQPLLPRNGIVVLITIDSVRAEVFSDPEKLARLPHIQALMGESVYFEQMRSVGAGTRVSFKAIFTGKHSFQIDYHHIRKDKTERFPERLSAAGIRSAIFVTYPGLLPRAGITRGFTEGSFVRPQRADQKYALAKETMDVILRRLKRHDGRPIFLFAHFLDPHAPYDAAGEFADPQQAQMAEIVLCDKALGRLIAALKANGVWDRTIVIVGSDHGEGFGKHAGIMFHNKAVYEEIAHVPMLFRIPGVPPRRVKTLVSSIDLGPTILDLFGVSTPGSYMGQSLVPLILGQDVVLDRPIVTSTMPTRFERQAYYKWPYKSIYNRHTKTVEVYDLSKDPDERDNIVDEVGRSLNNELRQLRSRLRYKKNYF